MYDLTKDESNGCSQCQAAESENLTCQNSGGSGVGGGRGAIEVQNLKIHVWICTMHNFQK